MTATTTTIRYGGVSPQPHKPAALGLEVAREVGGPVAAAAAFPNFTWHGGPVVHCPQIFASYWGDAWLDDPGHQNRAGRLNQFLKDLVGSKYMNILSQYGAGSGEGTGGLFMRASFVRNVTGNLLDGTIQATIQSCLNAGVIPEPSDPSNTCVVVYLAEGIGVGNSGDPIVMCEATSDTAFGYHSFFTTSAGHKCYYAVIPGLDDACLTESCPSDPGCSLHLSETQEQRQTQVTSHEFAEMVTDPELNAWFDPVASENGDICNGQADAITVGPNTWTVQRQYSKADDISTSGATICRTIADAPIPALTPGPSGLDVATARHVMRPGSFERLLPLPSVEFDPDSHSVKLGDKETQDYAKQLVSPLHDGQLATNLSQLLRQVADILEK